MLNASYSPWVWHKKPRKSQIVGNRTYSYDSIEEVMSRLAAGNSGYQVDSSERRNSAGARWISRQPECRSHRTSFHCPSQC